MTLALERPMSPACDSTLADDIRHLVDSLDEKIYDIVRDYQEIFCCEIILIDDIAAARLRQRSHHWQLEIHDSGEIELLHQKYLSNGELQDIGFTPITAITQFIIALIKSKQ